MSSRLPIRWLSRSAPVSMPASSSASSSRAPVDVVGAQRGDRRLDAGQRGAQVVGDGGEQGGADPVALGEPAGLGGLPGQPPAFQQRGGLRGEGDQHPAVLGGQHPAAEREHQPVADRDLDVGLVGHGDRVRADGRARCSRGRRRRSRSSSATDSMAKVSRTRSSSGVHAVLAAQHAARQVAEDLRLGPAAGGLEGAAGGEVDHGGDRDADRHEDRQRQQVLRVGDGEGVGGRGEVVVEQQRAEQGGGDGREAPRRPARRPTVRVRKSSSVGGQAGVARAGAQQRG